VILKILFANSVGEHPSQYHKNLNPPERPKQTMIIGGFERLLEVTKPPPSSISVPPNPGIKLVKAIVLWDSMNQYNIELQLKEGEIICIIDSKDDDWWLGYRQNDSKKTFGYFPAAYVQIRKSL